MKESEINNSALQLLNEFETQENIQPSDDWNQSLMNKLATAKPHSNIKFSINKFVVITLLIVLINIGFFLNIIIHDPLQNVSRNKELQIVSKELLINQPSFK